MEVLAALVAQRSIATDGMERGCEVIFWPTLYL